MRTPLVTVLALLAATLTTGCGLFPGAATDTCVDWIRFESPQQQFDDATLVVVGKPIRTDGETRIYGYRARIHLVDVEAVLKGEPAPGPLRIASTPVTCGQSYPDGDPLDGNNRMLIYASNQDGGWFTQTPAQGAVPFERDTPLPFRTS
ncbi:hypothetical protein ACQCSU_18835 [Pseudarthrobacter sp. O4]|uniref:hypothetical protein n=1 Tax=Pseudarthrobacter sp. O4 TaxID=3418417 RepID=UPI003CE941CE